VRKPDKNEYSVKELLLETANHSPWFCREAVKFIWVSKKFERKYVGTMKGMYSCWLRMRRNMWTRATIFSSDEKSFKRFYPLHFDISTADKNISRSIVLPAKHPHQRPNLCVTAETGWIKVTRYNFYTSWESTNNTNIRCGMETVQWEGQTKHLVWKQLSGNEGQNMEGFCGSGTCLKHV